MSLITFFSPCNIVFERHGVHYSLEGGSAIGAIRHQGLIPWDDDIDIAILVEDEKLLLGPVANDLGGVVDIFVPAPSSFLIQVLYDAFRFFAEQNYGIIWTPDTSADYKFFFSNDSGSVVIPKLRDLNVRYPFCDIFLYRYSRRDELFVYAGRWRTLSNNGFKTLDLSGGTMLTTFGNFEMRISLDIIRHLDAYYGNWRDVGVTQWYGHYRVGKRREVEFRMTPALYAPASPFD